MRLVPLSMSVLIFLYFRYCAETKKVSNFCSNFRSCDLDLCPYKPQYQQASSSHTIRHMCTKFYLIFVLFLEVVTLTFVLRSSISIGFLLSHHQACVYQVSFRSNISLSNLCSIFRSCDLDLCPTNLNINRLPHLITRHVCTKFHLDQTFHS